MIEYGLDFTAGLLGGLHCAGMCGPIVLSYSSTPVSLALPNGEHIAFEHKPIAKVVPHVVYNAGRVLSYSTVGAMAGMIGATFVLGAGLRNVVSLGLGVLMVLAGIAELRLFKRSGKGRFANGRVSRIIKGVLHTDTLESRFLLGFVTPLLPCGLLYGMVLSAASSGSPITGAIMMGLFALGSAPALLIVGLLAGALRERARSVGTKLAGVVIILMGLITVARGAGFVPPWMVESPGMGGSSGECCKTPPTIVQ